MKTFPKPLTAKEEEYYLQRSREGDVEARAILIEHNLRLVAHVVKKYQFTNQEQEDMLSVGTIGLIKAVNTFQAERGNKLSSYAAKCIHNEILMLLRSERKRSREVSLQEPIGTDKEGNEISLLDIIETGERSVADTVEMQQDVCRLCRLFQNCLPPKEQLVLRMRYGLFGGQEYTQREIAGQLGISRSYVSRIEKRALEQLREHFEHERGNERR